jgi:hypothetical protein
LATDSRAFSPGYNITGFQPSSKLIAGPVADEERFPIMKQELKGLKARDVMNVMHGIKITPFVPPLQGEGIYWAIDSRAFSPGYNITGFQPSSKPIAGPIATKRDFPL